MMTISQAKKMGVAAFRAGKGAAPALNREFLKQAIASGELIKMMYAYTTGWTYANLAENAIPGSPSIAALTEIDSN